MREFFCDDGTVSYPGCSGYTNDTWNKISCAHTHTNVFKKMVKTKFCSLVNDNVSLSISWF